MVIIEGLTEFFKLISYLIFSVFMLFISYYLMKYSLLIFKYYGLFVKYLFNISKKLESIWENTNTKFDNFMENKFGK